MTHAGSHIGPTAFADMTELNLLGQLVANAFTAPTDVPVVDTTVLYYDAAGNVVEWTYIVAVAAWKGVQKS